MMTFAHRSCLIWMGKYFKFNPLHWVSTFATIFLITHPISVCHTIILTRPTAFLSTLIDSTPGVLKAWETFSKNYSLGDSAAIAHATHGRRLDDTLKEYCHVEDEVKLRVRHSSFLVQMTYGSFVGDALAVRNWPFWRPGHTGRSGGIARSCLIDLWGQLDSHHSARAYNSVLARFPRVCSSMDHRHFWLVALSVSSHCYFNYDMQPRTNMLRVLYVAPKFPCQLRVL